MIFKEYLEEIKRTCPDLDCVYGIKPDDEVGIKGEAMQVIAPQIRLPKDLINQTHHRLGITSEINELMDALKFNDKVNIQEELVDILWYIGMDINIAKRRLQSSSAVQAAGFHEYAFTKDIQVTDGGWGAQGQSVLLWFHCIVYNISKLADLHKRDLAYEKPEPTIEYVARILYLLGAINNLAFELGIDMEEGMGRNIAKLRNRYPDKFSREKALNRDLDKEREALEGEIKASQPSTEPPQS